ncbi:hypothetical protein CHUAL_000383 [Chamberlinius hualienensis]
MVFFPIPTNFNKMRKAVISPKKAHSRNSTENSKTKLKFGRIRDGTISGLYQTEMSLAENYLEKYGRRYPDLELPYTDKDRAAAAAMGSKDIKVSLQVKKKRERKQDEPGEREFKIRFCLVEKELKNSNPGRALQFINKALEFRPNSKECYVARSKCNLLLGHLDEALKDADRALDIDRSNVKALYAKAEALYSLGDFESALVYYHRGQNLRPELEEFRLGIQKAEEVILSLVGDKTNADLTKRTRTMSGVSDKIEYTAYDEIIEIPTRMHSAPELHCRDVKSVSLSQSKSGCNYLPVASLGDLNTDIAFMQRLIENTDLKDLKPAAFQEIQEQMGEALQFLNSRKEFWSQQRPPNGNIDDNLS